MNELFNALCRHLMDGGETKATTDEFASMETNEERVAIAHALLQRFGLLPELKAVGFKNSATSNELREQGNQLFKMKKDGDALEMYTRSVAYGENGSETLGLAFANRSAVLLERKFYKECLQDIDNAFTNNYPSRFSDKLTTRRAKAASLLDQQHYVQHHFPPPKPIPASNPSIPCASNNVIINHSEHMGRQIVAAKDISPGDTLVVETPFACVLLKERATDHCHHCLTLCYSLLPCQHCSEAMFCTDVCKKISWDLYHKYECPVSGNLNNLELGKLVLLALRVTICARGHYGEIGTYADDCDVYESGRYREIHNLLANTEKRSLADIFKRATTAAVIYHLMKQHTEFFSDLAAENSKETEEIFCSILLLHLQTAPSNFHEISELVGAHGKVYQPEEIASGAYGFLSLLNHACSPNVVRHCYGPVTVMRALRPIACGEQLFDNYGYHYALMPKQERQEHLKSQYHFDCSCIACEENWPLYLQLSQVAFEVCIAKDQLQRLRQGEPETARVVIDGMTSIVQQLDTMIPCKNLSDAQEILKQCFAIFGNKRTTF